MNKPMIREHNISTNEVIDREMTDEEYAQYQLDRARLEQDAAEQTAKDAAKQAVLDKLGLTAEEVTALLN
jgi:ParB-like chromosome segregation protein Spo0J